MNAKINFRQLQEALRAYCAARNTYNKIDADDAAASRDCTEAARLDVMEAETDLRVALFEESDVALDAPELLPVEVSAKVRGVEILGTGMQFMLSR